MFWSHSPNVFLMFSIQTLTQLKSILLKLKFLLDKLSVVMKWSHIKSKINQVLTWSWAVYLASPLMWQDHVSPTNCPPLTAWGSAHFASTPPVSTLGRFWLVFVRKPKTERLVRWNNQHLVSLKLWVVFNFSSIFLLSLAFCQLFLFSPRRLQLFPPLTPPACSLPS